MSIRVVAVVTLFIAIQCSGVVGLSSRLIWVNSSPLERIVGITALLCLYVGHQQEPMADCEAIHGDIMVRFDENKKKI